MWSILLLNTFLEHKSAQASTGMDHKVHALYIQLSLKEVSQICFVFDKIIKIVNYLSLCLSVSHRHSYLQRDWIVF